MIRTNWKNNLTFRYFQEFFASDNELSQNTLGHPVQTWNIGQLFWWACSTWTQDTLMDLNGPGGMSPELVQFTITFIMNMIYAEFYFWSGQIRALKLIYSLIWWWSNAAVSLRITSKKFLILSKGKLFPSEYSLPFILILILNPDCNFLKKEQDWKYFQSYTAKKQIPNDKRP